MRFHIDLKMVPVIEGLARRVELLVFPCHPDTTDPEGWNYLKRATGAKYDPEWSPKSLNSFLQDHPETFLCDLGGEMIGWAAESDALLSGGMEGTTSGIKLIAEHKNLHFPVLDWNGAPLKLEIHNEKMVGFSIWQTFTEVTRLSLHGRSVGVLGYGLVGRGIARTARALGGFVKIYEPDSDRRTCAAYEGFGNHEREDVLGADVIVSATGVPDAVKETDMSRLKSGAFLLNAGHSEEEISPAIRNHPNRRSVLPHVEELSLGKERHVFLLASGRLLNLAAGFGDTINAFDVTSALLVETLKTLIEKSHELPRGLSVLKKP